MTAVSTIGRPEGGQAQIARVDPIGVLPLGDERGVYRQRMASLRLKSTARRLLKRRVGRRDDAQAFRAPRRNTALRSPLTLTTPTK